MGESVQTAILYHIGKIEGMNPSDLLKDPLRFAQALEKIFSAGSSVLEDKIIESMCRGLGIPLLNVGGSFEQKIAAVYASASSTRIEQEKFEEENDLIPSAFQSVSHSAL